MITKEKVKKEIDKIPNDLLEEVYKYINTIKGKRVDYRKIHTYKLNGQYDDLNIRQIAYE